MKIHVLNVRIPAEINNWLSSLVEKGIYKSRSEAIREFTRDFLKENVGEIK